MSKASCVVALAAGLAVLSVGCGSDPSPAPRSAGGSATAGAGSGPGRDTATPTSGSIQVGEKIAKACELEEAHFAFDSARVEGDAARTLEAVARCFISGPMKGKSMRLIGHADPRGETAYNFGLGQKRAGGVAEFLVQRGVSSAKVTTTSKGEMDATGTDKDGWARDRKVEIVLAE